MSQRIRISTIQSHVIPTLQDLKSDPFADDFVLADLFEAAERSLTWYDDLFQQAADNQCKLTVVAEDFTRTGLAKRYLDDRSIFRAVVEKQTPLVAERVGAAAKKHGMYIATSYYALEGDTIYNVGDLFDPKGEIAGRYRKVHLPQYELWQVAAGDSFPAFETDIGWISILICYDQVWPEATISCAMNGAQLICLPSAATIADYRMLTRAVDSQVHMVSSTHKNSMIASPRGKILANAEDRQHIVVSADVDLNESTKAGEYFWETLFSGVQDHKERHMKYRMPSTYGVLTDPQPPLAEQYATEGRVNTPEAEWETYEVWKEMHRKELRGEPIPYGWEHN